VKRSFAGLKNIYLCRGGEVISAYLKLVRLVLDKKTKAPAITRALELRD